MVGKGRTGQRRGIYFWFSVEVETDIDINGADFSLRETDTSRNAKGLEGERNGGKYDTKSVN